MPPPISWMISRSVIPIGTSIRPVLATRPASANTLVPLLFSVPIAANHSAPLRTMGAILAKVSTLLISVGHSQRPDSAREGRTRPRRAALAFDAGDQRRLLAADKGAGAQPYVDVEAEARAADAVAQQAQALGLLDGRLEVLHRQRILGAHVDEALLRAHRVGRRSPCLPARGADRSPARRDP